MLAVGVFGDALRVVGLPQQAIPPALLFFNIGVEIGQLMFIAPVFAVTAFVGYLGRRSGPSISNPRFLNALNILPACVIGDAALCCGHSENRGFLIDFTEYFPTELGFHFRLAAHSIRR